MKTINFSIILFLISFFSIDALSQTWTGGSGNWNFALNWDTGVVPKFGDHVIIPSGVTVTIFAPNIAKAKSLEIGPSSTLVVNAGAFCKIKDTDLNIRPSVENSGSIEVNGTFIVKHTVGNGSFGAIRNYNDMEIFEGGVLRMWDIDGLALYLNYGNLINHGLIRICDVVSGIHNVESSFTNHDSLSIHDVTSGILNMGTTNNYGSIGFTNNILAIENHDIFFNRFHGDIYIDNGEKGIYNLDYTSPADNKFINFGDIIIDGPSTYGILNYGAYSKNFINKPAGDITISNTDVGFECIEGSITKNYGDLTIDDTTSDGILVDDSNFTNFSSGDIRVSNCIGAGVKIENSYFYNHGDLFSDESLYGIELDNDGVLINKVEGPGMVYLNDNITGLSASASSFISNYSYMQTTNNDLGINLSSTSTLNSGGTLILSFNDTGLNILAGSNLILRGFSEFFDNIQNVIDGQIWIYNTGELLNYDQFDVGTTGTFQNDGIVRDRHAGYAHFGTNYQNDGVVSDLNEHGSWDASNASYIVQPWYNVQVGATVYDALNQGSQLYYDVTGIYTDETGSTSAGDYFSSTDEFIPSIDAVGLDTLYALMENLNTGVSTYFEIPVDGGVAAFKGKKLANIAIRMNENTEQEFNIFPNPTFGQATLEIINVKADMLLVEITDLQGRIIESKQMKIDNEGQIPVLQNSQLLPGQYILTVYENKDKIFQSQIIRK